MARKSRKTAAQELIYHVAVYIRTALYIRLSVEDNKKRGNFQKKNIWLFCADITKALTKGLSICLSTKKFLSGISFLPAEKYPQWR